MGWELRAPVTGKVIELLVAAGDRVEADTELIVIESMKMEIPVSAEAAGVVRQLHVAAEDTVQEGDLLLTADAV